ncbi:MAG: hypothetical protein JWP09_382 [Candidatus Taylorbacteria bacterium]|nr:hypothetical protein [Candidatus Taylorbacteria bacterium]
MNSQNTSKKIFGIVIAIIVLAVLVYAVFFSDKDDNMANDLTDTTSQGNTQDAALPVETTPVDTTKKPGTVSMYKDGTYSATGSYRSPGGADTLGVTLTLSNDVVTDVTVAKGAGDNTSSRFQDKFISGYKALVVGKNIADIKLSKVSGSSLTPIGFNDAVAQIQAQAKA